MNLLKFNMFAVIVLFVVACGPVIPYADATPTPSAAATTTAVPSPVPWPDINQQWITFSARAYITSTTYDPAGYLWITSSAGVYRWEFETQELTLFTVEDGLPSNVGTLTIFEGKTWVTTADSSGQVAYYTGENWVSTTVASPPCYANSLISTQSRLWWFGCGGVYYYESEQWKQFDQFPDEYNDEHGPHFYSVAESRDGSLWFQNYSGVLQFDGTSWKYHKNLQGFNRMLTIADGTLLFISDAMIISFDGSKISPLVFPGNTYRYAINQSLVTPEGNLWVQIRDLSADYIKEGYLSYVIHDGVVEQSDTIAFRNAPEMNNYLPRSITPFGWVFYDVDDLYLYTDGHWDSIQLQAHVTNDLVGKSVIGFSPDGLLWVMDGNQPRNFNGKEVSSPFEEAPCKNYYPEGRLTSNGSIWAVSSGYAGLLCYLNVETQQAMNYELWFDIAGWDIAPDDSIWVSSRAGFIANISVDTLRRGDYRNFEMIKVGGESLGYVLVPDRIDVDANGDVWVFVKDSGLYRYDRNKWKYFGLSSLGYPYVYSIDAKGTPWVGMCGKSLMHDGEKWIEYSQRCLNPSNMAVTSEGIVWFADSCDGVYRFDGQEWVHFENKYFGGTLVNKIIEAPDGAIWFIGNQKWTRYQE